MTGVQASPSVQAFAQLRGSFSLKVVALSLGATATALALAFSMFQWQDWQTDQRELVGDEIAEGRTILAAARKAADVDSPAAVSEIRAVLSSDRESLGAIYVSTDGRRIEIAGNGKIAPIPPFSDSQAPSWSVRGDLIAVQIPDIVDGQRIGGLVLEANATALRDRLNHNILVSLWLSLATLALSGGLAALLARAALRPLQRLDRRIAEVRENRNFDEVVSVTSSDEFGRLTSNFNALLAELRMGEHCLRQAVADLTVARDAAESASIMKSHFLANMSHEIRTPLNGMLGMAQAMGFENLPPSQRERLEIIKQSGASLLAVLSDILDLAKIEAGYLDLNEAPFDPAIVVQDACALFSAAAAEHGLTLSFEVDEIVTNEWSGDAVRLRRILDNLISNAVKFTERGSVRVKVDAAPALQGLRFSVADTGMGIAPDHLSTIFEKFVQLDGGATRRIGGTGLGLAICRELAERMGGSIAVFSNPGLGSIFEVTLPFTQLARPMPPESEPVSEVDLAGVSADDETEFDLSRLKVMVAEDNETNRQVMAAVLDVVGIKPLFVENGRLAVEAWSTANFDLILMDIQMPICDGVTATREIRQIEHEQHLEPTPIVAVTANAMGYQVAEYLAAGMDGHLPKPIEINRVFETLAGAANRTLGRTRRAA